MFVQTGKDATGTLMSGAQVAAKLIDGRSWYTSVLMFR